MKESIWMYFFATMGMTGIVLINIFGQIIVSNEQNYYLLKEVTEAAMYDAVDLYAIRNGVGYDGVTDSSDPESMHCISYKPGTVRIIKEKFVENFIRRFAENAELNRNYRVVIHDIDECPPKVSLSLVATNNFDFVTFLSVDFNNGETAGGADIVNSLSGILETVPAEKDPSAKIEPIVNITPPTITETTTDSTGGTGSSSTPSYEGDKTPPKCVYGGNSSWKKTPVTIWWGCEDKESGCNRIVGIKTYNGVQEAVGLYTARYTISDRAGNTTNCNVTIPVYYDNYTPQCSLFSLADGYGSTIIRMNGDEKGSGARFVGVAKRCGDISRNLYTAVADEGPGTYCGTIVDNVDLTSNCYITLYARNEDGTCTTGSPVGDKLCAK